MAVWFVRSNGDTLHNEPGSTRFVPGERPVFPDKTFNYREECLRDGFARVGWPATGDLRQPNWEERARSVYGSSWDTRYRKYLAQFATIRTGDVMVMPARAEVGAVHVGAVLLREPETTRILSVRHGLPAYRYFYSPESGARFENAHRVGVLWDAEETGAPGVHVVQGLGGPWRRFFTRLEASSTELVLLAQSLGLSVSG